MARLHADALKRISIPTNIVAVHDRDFGIAEEFASGFGTEAFTSLEEALAAREPQVLHVCTPAGTHFEPANAALLAGAHIYVEKPFVDTAAQATQLLDLAAARGLTVCAGHQLLSDPAYQALVEACPRLGKAEAVESRFTFAPSFDPDSVPAHRAAHQLLDILPHPLYTLVDAMERVGDSGTTDLAHVVADPTHIQAIFRKGALSGSLVVSLRARPIVSTLTVTGRGGTLSTDLVRSALIGAANPGTSPVEKILNPLAEGWQLQWRSLRSVARRLFGGGHYPGLTELFDAFYHAVATGGAPPLSPQHLRDVSRLFEQLADAVAGSISASTPATVPATGARGKPVAVVTGAGGFFGRHISAALARRGYYVRGIGRTPNPRVEAVHEWVSADLSREVPPSALDDADVVIHAAAATSGGIAAHQRHSIDASRNVVDAMHHAGVRRLVYISSIAVLERPRVPWKILDEQTPLASRPAILGPYTWGKCEAERLVVKLTAEGSPETCIVRPAALVDLDAPDMPGQLGRRLFGRWHLGLGRPGLPVAVCEVQRAADVVAWCAEHPEAAPPVINLWDPGYPRRRDAVAAFRSRGWDGRMIWIPIRLLGLAAHAARFTLGLLKGRLPSSLAIIRVLKPRRFRSEVALRVLESASRDHDATGSADREPVRNGYSRGRRAHPAHSP
jgi:predicted dehydrogenase/nucleoside-diphosphate-sugar epimerase